MFFDSKLKEFVNSDEELRDKIDSSNYPKKAEKIYKKSFVVVSTPITIIADIWKNLWTTDPIELQSKNYNRYSSLHFLCDYLISKRGSI